MTVSSSYAPIAYVGNGVTTVFAVTWTFDDETDIVVTERVIATGVETIKTLTTDYSVSGGDGSTGSVTAVVAPASTVWWVISRDTARSQAVDYVANDPFPAETHEGAIDKVTRIAQELYAVLLRAIRFPGTDSTSLSAELPSSVDRASKLLGFDSSGEPVMLAQSQLDGPIPSEFILDLLDDQDQEEAIETLLNGHYYFPDGFVDSSLFFGTGGRDLAHTGGLEGYYNTAVGMRALTDITTGSYNTFMGFEAGERITTGPYNTGFGEATQIYNVTGQGNTTLGWKAKIGIPSSSGGVGDGEFNTIIGYSAGLNIDRADGNVIVGASAVDGTAPTGNNNVAVGRGAMGATGLTSAAENVVIGRDAGAALTTGNNNTFVGQQAGLSVATGNYNTLIGSSANAGAGVSNTVVISDGQGQSRFVADATSIRLFAADGSTVLATLTDAGLFTPRLGPKSYLVTHSSDTALATQAAGGTQIGSTLASIVIPASGYVRVTIVSISLNETENTSNATAAFGIDIGGTKVWVQSDAATGSSVFMSILVNQNVTGRLIGNGRDGGGSVASGVFDIAENAFPTGAQDVKFFMGDNVNSNAGEITVAGTTLTARIIIEIVPYAA